MEAFRSVLTVQCQNRKMNNYYSECIYQATIIPRIYSYGDIRDELSNKLIGQIKMSMEAFKT